MSLNRVCAACFSDRDLRKWIHAHGGPRGCDACKSHDSPTAKFEQVVERIEYSLSRYYGRAIDQLGYNSAEGGYLGEHWDSWDMLGRIDLDFPRDHEGRLFSALVYAMTEEPWCDFDVGALNPDRAMWTSWESFCETVKHKRRFFFHDTGRDDRDSFTPASLLSTIAYASEKMGLVTELPYGVALWRARTDIAKGRRVTAKDFGPPPVEFALQSNRMNPIGIPMLYLASSKRTALKETRSSEAKVGRWRSTRALRVLDLRDLPPVPGVFSDASREQAHTLRFMKAFAADIMKPVARDSQVHIDYLPSQVVTEFFRDYPFDDGALDGVAYPSTVHERGWNVALFLGPVELGIETHKWGKPLAPAFSFDGSTWATS